MKEKEENKIQEIIEKENINLCDINFSLGLKKYYINSFKNIRTIYCDEEIQKKEFNIYNSRYYESK